MLCGCGHLQHEVVKDGVAAFGPWLERIAFPLEADRPPMKECSKTKLMATSLGDAAGDSALVWPDVLVISSDNSMDCPANPAGDADGPMDELCSDLRT